MVGVFIPHSVVGLVVIGDFAKYWNFSIGLKVDSIIIEPHTARASGTRVYFKSHP